MLQQTASWHVLYTCPHMEKKISKDLDYFAIPNYLPLNKVQRQWSDRKKIVELPLFPNYVFVQLPVKSLYTALQIPGVVKYVSFNGKPAAVPASVITDMQTMVASGKEIVAEERLFAKGERVMVMSGPLQGIAGIIKEVRGKQRLCLQLETLQQTLSVEIEGSRVELISPKF